MKAKKLLYLHGFNSSPESHKAQLVTQYLREKNCLDLLICPQIPVVPAEAKAFLEQLVEDALQEHELSFVGSSLGGYYATYLAEKYSGTAVLINPSVNPYVTLSAYLGENKFYFEDEVWEFNEEHIQQLKNMNVETITQAERYLVLLQTGDETLDYREAELMYKDAQCIIEQGGDHAFTNLERHLARIMQFSKILK
ncbi:Esterase YqiA [hydrothermal vent metagenome]|uniref:Esterase YqiA n=1 Tax=hydrothermal vent metagenome TaxID=652676 RepID=A0A3B0WNC7_9ZZZZ